MKKEGNIPVERNPWSSYTKRKKAAFVFWEKQRTKNQNKEEVA